MWAYRDGPPRFPIGRREGVGRAGLERPGMNGQVDPHHMHGRALSDHGAYDRPFCFPKKQEILHSRDKRILRQTKNVFLRQRISPHQWDLPHIHPTFIPGHALQHWTVLHMPTTHHFNFRILLLRGGSTRIRITQTSFLPCLPFCVHLLSAYRNFNHRQNRIGWHQFLRLA